ncbi:glycosyltransferase family 4 protein [Acidobacteria bacterium AB60]|nr:glycosyltransferase family 4 protein [Acidobacteria bacterium AB60]
MNTVHSCSSSVDESGTALQKRERMAVLMSHPTGNQNVRNALRALSERGMLAEFWTAFAWNPRSAWNKWLPETIRRQCARRVFEEAPRELMHCVPMRELIRLAARSTPVEDLLCSHERPCSVIGVYRHFDARVARRLRKSQVDAVYAYEGGALQTFREARRRGITTIYDLASGHWYWERNLLREEALRRPNLASIIPKLTDSERHMREKDEELARADVVIVASTHVRRTLSGVVDPERIKVVPYGAPTVRVRPKARDGREPLKVLFAGALHQRKGIGYLLEAVSMLRQDVELTLIGQRIASNAIVDAACQRARWFPTLPHDQVLQVMLQSDVLVLPSLSEGFGLVVTEALACGVPVIITANVGASGLVSDGREGYVVPVQSADSIAHRLSVLDGDRDLLAAMSENAQKTAARHTWQAYRQSISEIVEAASCR